ncbi:SprT family zinc-dependent metalloprotease [Teredinibacter purpureus]|uniref:DUF45 domain-containing protein n=1 Tax=Teredinibacter purpureus TaxID=2731756 RepID=UPI0005F7E0A8|nr:DUF45 domain-containing protein [Teredinibacter purpureus]
MKITKEYISTRYETILLELADIIPIEKWSVPPKGLGYTTKKTAYGLATPDGDVLINELFLDTTATTKLDMVIRHEFSHMAIGLHHHHNKRFRRVESLFGVDHSIDIEEELKQINLKINFKYTLLAHLEDGAVIDIGGVHRKTKRYTEYKRGYMSIKGVAIDHFEFIENSVPLNADI